MMSAIGRVAGLLLDISVAVGGCACLTRAFVLRRPIRRAASLLPFRRRYALCCVLLASVSVVNRILFHTRCKAP